MPRVGFEPKVLAFGRTKTVPALDRSANLIGTCEFNLFYF
jgi:hypothetical protein